jgi:hypothetical protein
MIQTKINIYKFLGKIRGYIKSKAFPHKMEQINFRQFHFETIQTKAINYINWEIIPAWDRSVNDELADGYERLAHHYWIAFSSCVV